LGGDVSLADALQRTLSRTPNVRPLGGSGHPCEHPAESPLTAQTRAFHALGGLVPPADAPEHVPRLTLCVGAFCWLLPPPAS